MTPDPIPLDYGRDSGKQPVPGSEKHPIREDLAYILPMATFLAFIWVGTKGTETGHGNTWYPAAYAARVVVVGLMLILFRHAYTKIRWNHWWLGVIVGVVGIFQWVGMQHLLEKYIPYFRPGDNVFNPDL